MEPLVTVVIPTYCRPQLVKRAVQSALAQTLNQIEVLVVLDGPDHLTRNSLAEIDDSRMKVIELPSNQGCWAARNAGVAAAQAKWIAHLDDDDEWMPQKLELQLEAITSSQYIFPIASCYLIARTPTEELIWPRRPPNQSEPLSEYLFVRNNWFKAEGLIQTSTIVTSKELLQKVPYESSSQKHDDWDWLLRAMTIEGVGIEFVPELLSVWYLGEKRPSLGSAYDWQYSLSWIQSQRDLVTPRAYSSFILADVSARAALVRDWKAFWLLLWEAIRFGKPRLKDLGLHLGMWLISPTTRGWLQSLLIKKHKALPT